MSADDRIDQLQKRFIQTEDMDEGTLATLFTDTLEQGRAAATRMATWLVVGNGVALTMCYGGILERGDAAPPMLSFVAIFFVVGLTLGFLAFVAYQTSLTKLLNILQVMYLINVANRKGLTPPPAVQETDWNSLSGDQRMANHLLMASALFFILGALSPIGGVLEQDFLDPFFEPSTAGAPLVEPPPADVE